MHLDQICTCLCLDCKQLNVLALIQPSQKRAYWWDGHHQGWVSCQLISLLLFLQDQKVCIIWLPHQQYPGTIYTLAVWTDIMLHRYVVIAKFMQFLVASRTLYLCRRKLFLFSVSYAYFVIMSIIYITWYACRLHTPPASSKADRIACEVYMFSRK